MVRVIGRIDQATPVYEALVAAGVEAWLSTAPQSAAVRATGGDRSDADVVVEIPLGIGGAGTCAQLKRRAPARPVVAVVPREHEPLARATTRLRRGPDAVVVWPADGAALAAGLEHARAAAGRPRPRMTRELLPLFLWLGAFVAAMLLVIGGALGDALLTSRDGGPGYGTIVLQLSLAVGFGLLGAAKLGARRLVPLGRGGRVLAAIDLVFAALLLASALSAVLARVT